MYSRAYLHPDLDGKWQNLVNTSLFQSLNTILQYIFDVRKSIILSFRLFSPTELIYSFTEVFRLLLHRHHRYSVTIFRYFLTKYYLVKYIISNEYLSALWRQKAEKKQNTMMKCQICQNICKWWQITFCFLRPWYERWTICKTGSPKENERHALLAKVYLMSVGKR